MSEKEHKGDKTMIITDRSEVGEKSASLEPYLIQISGRETGQMHRLGGKEMRIGRDPLCEIMLDDPHVSRMHAAITPMGNILTIKDSGSTNGVFVNGKKITEHVLQDGDKILIGTRLYFKFSYQDTVEQNYQQNLFRAANIDALTQLYNKKYFLDVLNKEFSFSRRNRNPLSLMMIDIDYFKKINDTYGHLAGDHVLKTLGQALLKQLRLENIACRYGGEEFAVILRNVNAEHAHTIAERLRVSVAQDKVVFKEVPISMTISIGIATFENDNFATTEDLLLSADKLLYEAKETGRNRTVLRKAA